LLEVALGPPLRCPTDESCHFGYIFEKHQTASKKKVKENQTNGLSHGQSYRMHFSSQINNIIHGFTVITLTVTMVLWQK